MKAQSVKDLMTTDPIMIAPDATLQEAAQKMKAIDCGILPVGTRQSLQGVITDRDIVIRAVAAGKDIAHEKVSTYMTPDICYCSVQDSIEDAALKMSDNKVSRLLVQDEKQNICGVLTFGHILRHNDSQESLMGVIECATGRKPGWGMPAAAGTA